jgi:lipoprotein-anchoring transpeptidase ErfK/SrfK
MQRAHELSSRVTAVEPKPKAKPKPKPEPAVGVCRQNSAPKEIIVSIDKQRLWACNRTTQVADSAVTTGATVIKNGVNDATPTGIWHIYAKKTNQHLTGCNANGCWDDTVAYWIPFDGAVGFHDANWQTFPLGSSQYHTDGSHGCVHLPAKFIAWLYGWASVGTQVVVHK